MPTRIATCANQTVESLVSTAMVLAVVVWSPGLVFVVTGLGRAAVPVSKVVAQTSSRESYPKYTLLQDRYPK